MAIVPVAAGQVPTAAELNAMFTAAFPVGVDGWTNYVPVVTQGVTVTATVTRAAYTKVGRTVTVNFDLALTSAGTAANTITVTLPFTAASGTQIGSGMFLDASVPTRYVLASLTGGSATMSFRHDTSGSGAFGGTPGVTIASGDSVQACITYEATS